MLELVGLYSNAKVLWKISSKSEVILHVSTLSHKVSLTNKRMDTYIRYIINFFPNKRWRMILVSGFWQNWSFWVVSFVGKLANLVLYGSREFGWFLVLCVLGLFKRRIPPLSSKVQTTTLKFYHGLQALLCGFGRYWERMKIISWVWGPPIQQEPPNDHVNSMAGPVTLKSPSRLVCWKLGF